MYFLIDVKEKKFLYVDLTFLIFYRVVNNYERIKFYTNCDNITNTFCITKI